MYIILRQFYHSDASPTELYVFVTGVHDGGDGAEILTDELAEGSCASAVKDADAGHTNLCGVVDEMLDGIEGFVTTHPSYVDLLLEMEALLAHGVLRLASEESDACRRLLFLRWLRGYEAINTHRRSHLTKQDCGLLAIDALDDAHGGLTFEANIGRLSPRHPYKRGSGMC